MAKTKQIRILHVVGAMNRGGTETMLMNLYRNLDHKHVQFDFISYGREKAHYDDEIQQLGGRIIHLTKTASIGQLYQAIQTYGPFAAVHAHTLFHCGLAMIAARLAKVPVRVSHAHTTSDDSQTIIRKTYIKCMQLFIQKYSTHLLACSEKAGLYLFGDNCLTAPNYRYFPNVIDYQSFLNAPQTDVRGFKVETGLGNHLVLGHIGTFKDVKNHTFLLDMMDQLKGNLKVKMLLVGDGELKEEMQQKAQVLGIENRICFTGVREDIQTVLHSIDLFVFPSLAEGLGLVLLEAQASGVPCLVSEVIQPEADLDLGLVTRMCLAAGPQAWAHRAGELASGKERDRSKISSRFEEKGYAIQTGISKLLNIYGLSRGDEHEEGTNFVL